MALVFEECAKEPVRDPTVRLGLDQNVEVVSVLIDGSPQVFRTPSALTSTSSRCHLLPGRGALCRSRRAYSGPNLAHQVRIVSHVTSIPRSAMSNSGLAERKSEPMVEPHAVDDDLPRKPESLVRR